MEEPDFWLDNDKAQIVIADCNKLRAWTKPCQEVKQQFKDLQELLPEAYDLEDEHLITELLEELKHIENKIEELEIRKMLSGELDSKNCYLRHQRRRRWHRGHVTGS
jgi:peptide chain release factor 2